MGDTFSRVSESRVEQSLQQRAEYLIEMAADMSARQRADPYFFPRALHVIKRNDEDEADVGWEGQLGVVKKSIGAVESKLSVAKTQIEAKVDDVKADVKAKIDATGVA